MEIFNKKHLISPYWKGRNRLIAEEFLEPNKTILDLGCGSKILLNYYKPLLYTGVDIVSGSDLILNLNSDFIISGYWDYAINSGILEYVDNVEKYFEKIKGLAREYIFTWWSGTGYGRMPHSRFESLLSKYYSISQEKYWSPVQKVYKCY